MCCATISHLNGPKYGCGLGECGTCTVLIDGVAARSCVIPIEGCVGRDIVTLEGLGTREHPDPVQAGLHRGAGRAMRLLPQRHDHDHQGAADAQPASDRSRDRSKRCATISAAAARMSKSCARRCGPQATRSRRGTDGRPLPSGSERGFARRRPAAGERTFETFIRITADGSVNAYNGHVDLGTGIRTALGQIVAEELDVSFARVVVVLGDTAEVPEPGPDDRQRDHPDHRRPLAQGRGAGAAVPGRARGGAAGAAGRRADDRRRPGPRQGQSQRQLWRIDRAARPFASNSPMMFRSRRSATTRIVGQSVPRVDLPAKATGELDLCA